MAGTAITSVPMPTAQIASSTPKPMVMPSMCGMERRKPNQMPDEASMMLLGPGVMEETKANVINGASGSSKSMGFSLSSIPC
ncbi:hypothetical protein D3C86_2115120 [compost metagenome]